MGPAGLIGLSAGGDLLGTALQAKFNADSAEKQMNFQERMSSTAYQRAAQDLQKAGLNRVLALGNPASSPSGASASINAPDLGGSAVRGASAKAAISLQQEQQKLLQVQQDATAAQAENYRASTEKTRAETPNVALAGQEAISRIEGNQAGIDLSRSQQSRIQAELPKIAAEIKMLRANVGEAEFKKLIYQKFQPLLESVLSHLPGSSAKDVQSGTSNIKMFLNNLWEYYKHTKTIEDAFK